MCQKIYKKKKLWRNDFETFKPQIVHKYSLKIIKLTKFLCFFCKIWIVAVTLFYKNLEFCQVFGLRFWENWWTEKYFWPEINMPKFLVTNRNFENFLEYIRNVGQN